MRQINLLPSEVFERRRVRQVTYVTALGVALFIALEFMFFLVQAGRLATANGNLDEQNRRNKSLERQVASLARAAQIQEELQNKTDLLSTLTENEVRWSVVLNGVATYIPADVWLTNITGTVQTAEGTTTGATGAATAQTFGALQFSGCTLEPADGTHLEVAKWLVRIGMPKELINPYLSVSTKGSDACPVSFSSNASLSSSALRRNQPGGERSP